MFEKKQETSFYKRDRQFKKYGIIRIETTIKRTNER